MDTSDLISIIIPVFNPGKYFIRCIESCINQTYTNLEIVLVDDCSTDPYTVQLLNEYAAKDPRIRLLKSPQNSGQAYCRNMGIDACKGKYFAMIDNDDSFSVKFIERTHEAIVKYDTDLVLADICVYADDSLTEKEAKHIKRSLFDLPFKKNAVLSFDFLIDHGMFFRFPLTVYSKLFNTERYRQSGLRFDPDPTLRSVEDEMWCSRLEFMLKNFYFMPFVGVFRCIRTGSDGTESYEYCQRSLKSIALRYKFVCDHGLKDKHSSSYLSYLLQRCATIISTWDKLDDRYRQLEECFTKIEEISGMSLRRLPARYLYTSSYNWQSFYNGIFRNYDRPNVWFFSLHNITDNSVTDVSLLRRQIDGMVDAGFRVMTIGGSIYKEECGISLLKDFMSQLHNNMRRNSTITEQKCSIYRFADNAAESLLVNLQSHTVEGLTDFDHRLLEQVFTKILPVEKQHPKVVMVTGSDPCSLKLFALFKQIGLRLIYVATGQEDGFVQGAPAPAPLHSSRVELGGQYTVPETGAEVLDMFEHIITFSPVYAEQWRQRFTQPITNLGYIERQTYAPKLSDEAQYVSITRSTLECGLAVFLKAAICLNSTNPEIKFLLHVSPDFPLEQILETMHFADGTKMDAQLRECTNIQICDMPINLDSAFDKSLVMMLPVLADNHSLEPVLNSLTNGVPVITTDNGEKLEQEIKGGVTYLPVPASSKADPYCLPSDEEIAPYLEAIKQVMAQDHVASREAALHAFDVRGSHTVWNKFFAPYAENLKNKD